MLVKRVFHCFLLNLTFHVDFKSSLSPVADVFVLVLVAYNQSQEYKNIS